MIIFIYDKYKALILNLVNDTEKMRVQLLCDLFIGVWKPLIFVLYNNKSLLLN